MGAYDGRALGAAEGDSPPSRSSSRFIVANVGFCVGVGGDVGTDVGHILAPQKSLGGAPLSPAIVVIGSMRYAPWVMSDEEKCGTVVVDARVFAVALAATSHAYIE